jgi:DNA polymerase-3 subunit gamma/tau
MSYQALARKWRPQTFRDIIGQESVVRTIQNAIEQQRVHHAYLFSGVRGVGKTTAARIFAKAINCVKGPTAEPCNECSICREITEGIDLDVLEIDAATYTGVDNVRELRDITQFQPARDRKRIFIIDEAHMLSTPSWNALLKLIEEPPPHMMFIMATTEMQKVPATILSRVQRFTFSKITQAHVVGRLQEIVTAEGMEAEPAALEILARRGEGSVRDSLSLLDQVRAFSGNSIRAADVTAILGISDSHFFARLADCIREGRHADLLTALDEAAESGRDFKLLFRDFLAFLRNLLLLRGGAPEAMLSLTPDELSLLRECAAGFEYTEILRILSLLIRDDDVVSRAEQQRLAVEISLLKAATLPRLRAVEEALQGGAIAPSPPAPATPRPAARPAAVSAPAQAAPPPAVAEGALESFVDRVRSQRRLTGTYLEQARSARVEEDTVVFEYDPSHIALGHLGESEQLQFLERVAADVFGRRMKISLRGDESAAPKPAATQKSLLSEDPVLQGFARHLGGEVVVTKKKRTEKS